MIETLKRKCTSFFEKEDRSIIGEAVEVIHSIMSEATHLLKAYYLKKFDIDSSEIVIVDAILLSNCCDIVRGHETLSVRQREVKKTPENETEEQAKLRKQYADKKASEKKREADTFKEIYAVYKDVGISNIFVELSISHILSYSVEQMITAYKNNVFLHFPKYVKRYVTCIMMSEAGIGRDFSTDNTIKQQQRTIEKDMKKTAAKIANNLLYGFDFEGMDDFDIERFRISLPDNQSENRLYDMKKHYNQYISKMVFVNRELETMSTLRPGLRKLYNPISLTSSLVPGHIRLDTAGITQLLMSQERIKEFKTLYDLEYGVIPNIINKGDMLSSYTKIFGKKGTDFQEANYATEYWKYICNFKNYQNDLYCTRRNGVSWVFDNMILTDGHSISFQIIEKAHFKKASFVPTESDREEKKKNAQMEKDPFHQPSEFDLKEYKKLGGDPGKADLLFLTDGIRTARYTKGMRNQDTYKKMRMRRTKKIRGKYKLKVNDKDVSVADYESNHLSETSKKTCYYAKFIEYWKKRQLLSRNHYMYKQPWFREAKFLVYCRTRSSEAKFMNKVKKVFSGKLRNKIPKWMTGDDLYIINNARKSDCPLLCGYGNWGRNPNLKNNAPTPGIGLRRRFDQKIPTITVCEKNTSQTCPCCGVKGLVNEKVGEDNIEKHHLLCCTNSSCECRWWNRNVVGSYNILGNFLNVCGLITKPATSSLP